MKQYSTVIGMDLGDKHSHCAMMDESSTEILEQSRVRTTGPAMRAKFGGLKPCLVVIEAGTHSPWVSRTLKQCGHEVLVANPRKLRMIYQNETKDDTIDAAMLARVARMDPALLYPIEHRSKQGQVDLETLNGRNALVEQRTALINHVRSVIKSFGARLPKCDADTFHAKVSTLLPTELTPILSPILDVIAMTTKTIHDYDARIDLLCETTYPEAQLFQSVKGIGPITALAFALIIEDPKRFDKSRDVGSYLGLTPRRDQSGAHDPQLRITKAGNSYLRRLLVCAAHYLLGPLNQQDSELRQWGLTLAGATDGQTHHNKRLKKRAVVAVARKLAVLLHTMWTTGECYQPFYTQERAA